ncbi:2-C-methyl-D-erythritol 2,4-cyclodiphosphate synthase [Candidatus Magnetomoraceae bacterium gMMP-15]
MRIGQGYDVHKLVPDRKLILGGITIPYEKGLLGHSDADVLLHAVCDALLGAAGLGDIGMYFPDTDPKLKDISSIKLLSQSYKMIYDKGFIISNIDITLIAEAPKIGPYREDIRKNIANVLKIETNRINIKATTTEGLGFTGQKQGIAAMCVASLKRRQDAASHL